jgi:integrase
MTSARKRLAPALTVVSHPVDNHHMNRPRKARGNAQNFKSIRLHPVAVDIENLTMEEVLKKLISERKNIPKPHGKGVSFGEYLTMRSVAGEIDDRWGSNPLGRAPQESLFEVNGAKPHTIDHVECPACQAFDEKLKANLRGMADQTFPEAAQVWQGLRRNSNTLRPRTHESVDEYITALSKFFKNIRMSSINPGMLKAYQEALKANAIAVAGKVHRPWNRIASHSHINHELNVLAQMLRACTEWEKIRPYSSPLKLNSWSPREILNEKEEEELFRKVAGYPEAELAYCVAAITNNTTASGIELRSLKRENVYIRPGEISEIYIPSEACKNKHRPRKIALNDIALWAVKKVRDRAFNLGSTQPEHYLFPFRVKRNKYDPTRPATRWFLRCSWNHLRDISDFHKLRPHDLRHLAITRMLEKGLDGELVNSINGHVSKRMREFYSHQRTRVRYEAAQAIEPDYNVRKLIAEGRRRIRLEQLREQRKPKQKSMA